MVLTIKRRLIATVAYIFLVSTTFMAIFTYHSQKSQLQESFKDLAKNQKNLFQNTLTIHAEGLALANTGLTRLESLAKPFAEKRKNELLATATPILRELKQIHNVTHMYFIEPDGKVFLRVHKPEQFGDQLSRVTFSRATKTGKTASGLEMGKNFFSLRCVSPISYGGKIIGYVEVAEEIDHVFGEMKAINATETSLFLPKEYLESYGIDFATERVADLAILYPTDKKLSRQLAEKCREFLPKALKREKVTLIDLPGGKYVAGLSPIEDAGGSTAGILFSHKDVTPHFSAMWEGIASSLLPFIAIYLVSSVLFYFSLKKSLILFSSLKQDIQMVTRTSDLSKRLEVSTHDEIGDLADDFNRMKAEIEKLHEKLALRAEELSAANQELERFNYMVSHDLRKPLTAINAYCQAILMRDDTLEPEDREYVNEIYQGTLRMNELIDALLKFSASARSELNRERVDLSRMAEIVAAELTLAEPGRVARFDIANGITGNGDQTLLRQVLENLLGNAWKYTGKREEAIIAFGTIDVAGEQAYFVRDNGIGFDPAQAGKLFVPFQRLPGAEAFKGDGIGLATAARIIQRHGGRLWAEGEPGKGATFYFTLEKEEAADVATAAASG